MAGRGLWRLLGLFFSVFVFSGDCLNETCFEGDRAALVAFLRSAGIEGVAAAGGDCCSWDGISCGAGGRVVGVRFENRSLGGFVSPAIAELSELQRLSLRRNSLSRALPAELLSLPRLRVIDVSDNAFSGGLPASLTLPAMETLNVSYNQFNGSLPVILSAPRLVVLDISRNSFSGGLDAGVCSASPAVRVLRYSMNALSGSIPAGFAACRSATELSADGNALNGTLPEDLFAMPALKKLCLQENSLSGELSPKLGALTALEQVDLSLNSFSGALPDVFDKLLSLQSFSAPSNNLTGLLPASLSRCPTLKVLSLRNNSLSGTMSLDFAGMPMLNTLDLGTNRIAGEIPPGISQCKSLKTLNLARNRLAGEIPSSFSSLTSLSYLSLTRNNFTNLTSALQTLQFLPNLTSLVLTNSFRHGEVLPAGGIAGFRGIQVLVMANCALAGAVPPWLASLTNLSVLDLSWNQLTGPIPPWIAGLDQLFYLDLSNNSLSGDLPASLGTMRSLVTRGGRVRGSSPVPNFPFFIKRNSSQGLQYNQVSSFPPSLILSNNRLAGAIPPEFGNLVRLHVLDLSWNAFSGAIPDELSRMASLETLDLSHNNLSGGIPSSLTKLSFLSKFSVAYNDLTGAIPTAGQFITFGAAAFDGNPGLCSPRNCSGIAGSPPAEEKKKNRGAVIGVAVGVGLGVAVLLIAAFVVAARLLHSRRQEHNATAVANAEDGSSETSASSTLVLLFQSKDGEDFAGDALCIDDILRATDNFDSAYIVGCGGFGLVYKASLPDGRTVAIKKLSGEYNQIEREFTAEIETLSRARHPNLVLLQGYCKLAGDRLLIYSYMENGSLDYWLHERGDGGAALGWRRRLRIAQGAARGLAYLHFACSPHILHRDVKSSNILLDGDFEAHLADFGLARLILPYDTHVTTDVVGTLGYIPPEYAQSAVATFKGDVYSFGIVLLELITGHRPVDMCRPKGSRDVVSWVRRMRMEGRDGEVFDRKLLAGGEEDEALMMRVLDVACLCVADAPKSRPTSEQLLSWLDNVAASC